MGLRACQCSDGGVDIRGDVTDARRWDARRRVHDAGRMTAQPHGDGLWPDGQFSMVVLQGGSNP
jgi:hypothetical protein